MNEPNDDISKILKNSSKAELLEALARELQNFDKAIVVLLQDNDDGSYTSNIMTLGLQSTYEAYGILDVAKLDLQEEDY